jgi:hypothetical protein
MSSFMDPSVHAPHGHVGGSTVRGMAVALRLLVLLTGGLGGYLLLVCGARTIDLGVGRRIRPLGPLIARVAAQPERVFDVIAAPYLGRTPTRDERQA